MSLFSTLSISSSGMQAQRTRAELLVENIANAETTRTPGGGPYRRKDAVFTSSEVSSPFASMYSNELAGLSTGVGVSEIKVDDRTPDMRYLPGHPDADANGYVAFPKVNAAEEVVDLMGASRGFQANISAMSAVKDMIQKSIDLLK
jgi:flagellar basal-body rod protein FlgC